MKNILVGLVLLCTTGSVIYADHDELETLARRLTPITYELMHDARTVIGPYPSQRQRYAYEHIQFLYQSAARFQSVVTRAEDSRDHQQIENAYYKLSHDAYYARQTFRNLFYNRDHDDGIADDHANLAEMDRSLRDAEWIIYEMRRHLS